MTKPIAVEVLNKAVAHYSQTKSCIKSGKAFGMSASRLHRELVARGILRQTAEDFKKRITKLPPVEVWLADYQSGVSSGDIAARYGATNFAVIAALKKAGIKRKGRGGQVMQLTPERESRLRHLHAEKHPYAHIAVLMDTVPSVISRWCRLLCLFKKENRRERHGQWKGGRHITSEGYVRVLLDADDPLAVMRGDHPYVLEHRLVMARSIGRALRRNETVHHVNGNTGDNRISNLQLRQGKHGVGIRMQCCDCGSHNIEPVKLT